MRTSESCVRNSSLGQTMSHLHDRRPMCQASATRLNRMRQQALENSGSYRQATLAG